MTLEQLSWRLCYDFRRFGLIASVSFSLIRLEQKNGRPRFHFVIKSSDRILVMCTLQLRIMVAITLYYKQITLSLHCIPLLWLFFSVFAYLLAIQIISWRPLIFSYSYLHISASLSFVYSLLSLLLSLFAFLLLLLI